MTSDNELNVGEATIKLLEQYGVDTVFGIPGVHTLDYCRGLTNRARVSWRMVTRVRPANPGWRW
jgi:thiamine pyrophosphate-dependent acetolactate synthase large subunit-like protein